MPCYVQQLLPLFMHILCQYHSLLAMWRQRGQAKAGRFLQQSTRSQVRSTEAADKLP
jgi:hypothetical protein